MFFFEPYFYYITIGLQAICVIHSLRKGNQNKWLWVIIFLPVIGSLIYIFSEMFSGNEVSQVQKGLGAFVNPGGRIKKLEEQLRFADTFTNKVQLADAYLATSQTEKAVTLYEKSLNGVFAENEYVLLQLIEAYSQLNDYPKVITAARKVYPLPQFLRSRQHLLYAMALEATGVEAAAEAEFKQMTARFSNFEARYQYGQFLLRHGRESEAFNLYHDMIDESRQLSPRERSANRQWVNLAKESLRVRKA